MQRNVRLQFNKCTEKLCFFHLTKVCTCNTLNILLIDSFCQEILVFTTSYFSGSQAEIFFGGVSSDLMTNHLFYQMKSLVLVFLVFKP